MFAYLISMPNEFYSFGNEKFILIRLYSQYNQSIIFSVIYHDLIVPLITSSIDETKKSNNN